MYSFFDTRFFHHHIDDIVSLCFPFNLMLISLHLDSTVMVGPPERMNTSQVEEHSENTYSSSVDN